jgi:hypothetical protein
MAPKTAGGGHKSTGGGSANAAAGNLAGGGGGGKSAANVQLQDRLHELLSKLAGTIEDVKDWPENVDSAGHYKTTTKLIDRIQEVIKALKRVEDCINNKGEGHKNNATLREHLQKCLIPMDLLELLDHNASTNMHDKEFGLNPECYASGLLREAMFQLAGLKRRKNALEMLGNAIERGLAARNNNSTTTKTTTTTAAAPLEQTEPQSDAATAGKLSSLKRGRDQSETTTGDAKKKAKS